MLRMHERCGRKNIEFIEAIKIRIKMRHKRRDNGRQREKKAIVIAERNQVRAVNELLGIITPRYMKPK